MPVDSGRYPHEEALAGDAAKPPIVADPPPGPVSSLADKRREWLRRLGFFRVDPFPRSFDQLNAEREIQDKEYESYLVEPPAIDNLPEQGSGILFARRGDGKTTSCQLFKLRHSAVFWVEYTDFDFLISHLSKLTLGHHIYAICRQSLFTLARRMHIDEIIINRYQLDQQYWIFLIDEIFKQRAIAVPSPLPLTWIAHTVKERPAEFRQWYEGLTSQDKALVHLALCLVEVNHQAHPSSREDTFSPDKLSLDLFQRFFQALNTVVGCLCTYILIDKVDAFAETKSLDEAQKLLRHLIGTDQLHEIERVYFRFFLPSQLKEPLSQYMGHRIAQRDLKWQEEELHQLVNQRLMTASDSRVGNLEALTSHSWGPRSSSVIKEFFAAADGSPRNILALCHELFNAHVINQTSPHQKSGATHQASQETLWLNEQDFRLARQRFAEIWQSQKMKTKWSPSSLEPGRFNQIAIPVTVIIILLLATGLILAAVFRAVPDLGLTIPLSIVLILLMVLSLAWIALAMGWISPKVWQQIQEAVLRRLSLPRLGGEKHQDKGPP